MRRLLLIILMTTSCSSMQSIDEKMIAWEGEKIEKLLQELGRPKFIEETSEGEVAIWHFQNPQSVKRPATYCADGMLCDSRSTSGGQAERSLSALEQRCILGATIQGGRIAHLSAEGRCDRFLPARDTH